MARDATTKYGTLTRRSLYGSGFVTRDQHWIVHQHCCRRTEDFLDFLTLFIPNPIEHGLDSSDQTKKLVHMVPDQVQTVSNS